MGGPQGRGRASHRTCSLGGHGAWRRTSPDCILRQRGEGVTPRTVLAPCCSDGGSAFYKYFYQNT
jgi:hypothetical protein